MSDVQVLSKLNDLLGTVLEKEPLAKHTTLRIGGPARYWYDAEHSDDMIKAVEAAKELGLDYVLLGAGSNILVSDQGFDGLVIHAKNINMRLQGEKLYVEAGVMNAQAAKETVNAGLSGLEWLASIPGTIGGAIYGNAGCYGHSIKDVISKVDIYREGAKKRLSKKECQFGYRDSIFKKSNDIILSAEMILKPGQKSKSLQMMEEYLNKRKKSQPLGKPAAGSTFKNFKFYDEKEIEILKQKIKDIPDEYLSKRVIPAGWLIEQVGGKGMEMGGLQISDVHANWIINNGKGRADEFVMLVSKIKMLVRDELGIQLQEEIQYIGF